MDGLEISEVAFSNIDLGDRYDAEYFTKEYLDIEQQLKKVTTKKLGTLATAVASAFYPAATQLYSIGDTAFVRCVDCIEFPIITYDQDAQFEKIPYSFGKENKGISFLNKGEIVITKVGTPCYASIVEDYEEVALSRTVMGLSNIHGIDAYYLMVFLRCKYGFEQLYRQRELTIQYQLTLPRVKAVDVFCPSENFQKIIREICLKYRELSLKSTAAYEKAENRLSDSLGISAMLFDNTIAIKSFADSFQKTGRLDAEYYQPKYDYFYTKIVEYGNGHFRIGDVAEYVFTGEYSDEYLPKESGRKFYIRGTNMKNGRINIDENYYVDPSNHQRHVSVGDIVTTRVGTVGLFAEIDDSLDGAICSDNVICFRLPNYCKPDVYTLLLNSRPIHELIDRLARGSVQQRLNQETLRDVVLPVLAPELQKELSDAIQVSFSYQTKANMLLDYAKQAVEMAIECGEEAAITLLEDRLFQMEV